MNSSPRSAPAAESTPRRQALRYLVAGGINTAGSYALYFLLLAVLPYRIAYTIAFVAGIAASYWLNARFVFRVPLRLRDGLRFPAISVGQYVAGLAIVSALVEGFGVHPAWAALAAIVLTVPLAFLATRWMLRRT
jgi:putative flippase GtrA